MVGGLQAFLHILDINVTDVLVDEGAKGAGDEMKVSILKVLVYTANNFL